MRQVKYCDCVGLNEVTLPIVLACHGCYFGTADVTHDLELTREPIGTTKNTMP